MYSEGDLVRAGAAIGTADNVDHFSDILGLMWSQAEVSIPDEIDSGRAQDALTFYTNFAAEDQVWDSSFPEASTAFANGKVSMIFVPSWKILDILEASPSLDIGVAQVPQAVEENPVSWGSFWMEGVSADSTSKRAAWDFLNFLIQQDQQLSYFSQSSNYRAFGAPYARKDLSDELSLNDYLRPYVMDAPNSMSAEVASRAGNERQVEALRTAVESVLEGADAASALTQAKAKMSQ
jgi:ABC-type glycerol-3-phosphate transport system substrate-binding protein